MKLLLLLILINSVQSSPIDKFKLNNDYEDVGNYLNKLISDFNSRNNEIHDVAIINLITRNSEVIFDQVVRGIPQENPIRLPEIDKLAFDDGIKKCGFVIVITESDDINELTVRIQMLRLSTYWSISSKVIFISTNGNYKNLFSLFVYGKISNGIILIANSKTINVKSYDYFNEKVTSFTQNMMNRRKVFKPSILTDLRGYNIKLMIHYQLPKILIDNKTNKFVGKEVDLLRTIAKHLNANLSVGLIPNAASPEIYKEFFEYAIKNSKVDISLNTNVMFKGAYNEIVPRLLIYDEDAYCALVPLPKPKGFFEIALRPFDRMTWILLLIALISCVAVIIIFRCCKLTNSSPLQFLFMVYGIFLSQSSRMRENSMGMKIIHQFVIFMILILSYIYNSVITSSLISGREGEKYSTFNQLFKDEKFNFIMSEYIYNSINQSDDLRKVLDRSVLNEKSPHEQSKLVEYLNASVIISKCELLESMLYLNNYTFLADKYYMLPEKFYKTPIFLYMSVLNPLRDTFQHITDRSFEGGLMEYWKTMHSIYLADKRYQKDAYEMDNENFYLKMNDLTEVFYILIIGWIVSACIFMIEIFWHDCLSRLSLLCCKSSNLSEMKDGRRKTKIRKIKVRKFRVRPINVDE